MLSVSERTFAKEVLEAATPVMVHFWAPWCGLCKMIEPILKGFQEEKGEQIKVVSFDADLSLKLAFTYKLNKLPTLILFEGGQVKKRIEGFQSREDLQRQLQSLIELKPIKQKQEMQKQEVAFKPR